MNASNLRILQNCLNGDDYKQPLVEEFTQIPAIENNDMLSRGVCTKGWLLLLLSATTHILMVVIFIP